MKKLCFLFCLFVVGCGNFKPQVTTKDDFDKCHLVTKEKIFWDVPCVESN